MIDRLYSQFNRPPCGTGDKLTQQEYQQWLQAKLNYEKQEKINKIFEHYKTYQETMDRRRRNEEEKSEDLPQRQNLVVYWKDGQRIATQPDKPVLQPDPVPSAQPQLATQSYEKDQVFKTLNLPPEKVQWPQRPTTIYKRDQAFEALARPIEHDQMRQEEKEQERLIEKYFPTNPQYMSEYRAQFATGNTAPAAAALREAAKPKLANHS